MAPKINLAEKVQNIASKQPPGEDRQPTINYGISTRAEAPELPTLVATLSERLQDLARQYIGARRRTGEALLEAARWLSEARAEAQHGEWSVFLEATGTSDDTAERLLNIHRLAMQNPQFAESVRTNQIGQSIAGLLSQPSTPPEVVAEVLSSPQPPTVAEVQKKIRQARPPKTQTPPDLGKAKNPQFADFTPRNESTEHEQPTAIAMLHEVKLVLAHVEHSVNELPAGQETSQALEQIEQALASLRRAFEQRS